MRADVTENSRECAATKSKEFVGEAPPGESCDGLPNACQIAHNLERLAKNGGSKVVACRPSGHRRAVLVALGRDSLGS
jgi:hypothetical protein